MIFRESQWQLPNQDREMIPGQTQRISGGALLISTTEELLQFRAVIEGVEGPSIANHLLGDGEDIVAKSIVGGRSANVDTAQTTRLVDGEAARQISMIANRVGWPVENVDNITPKNSTSSNSIVSTAQEALDMCAPDSDYDPDSTQAQMPVVRLGAQMAQTPTTMIAPELPQQGHQRNERRHPHAARRLMAALAVHRSTV